MERSHLSVATDNTALSTEPPVFRSPSGLYLLVCLVGVLFGLSQTWWIGLPLAALGALAASVPLLRGRRDRSDAPPVLRDPHELNTMREALDAIAEITDAWPKLRSVIRAPAPHDVLARALWDLARVLAHRQAIRDTRHELCLSRVDLPKDSQVYAEVMARIDHASARYAAVDADVAQRLAQLTGLARHCERFLREQAALERARHVVRAADEVLGGSDALSPVDAGEELVGSTTAVLDAYRQLSLELGVDDLP